MSLAITAAPFDTDNYSELNPDDTPINRKRNSSSTHNKTQKRISNMNFDPERVNSVLKSIHNNSNDNELGDFNPKRNQASATQSPGPINPLNPSSKLLAPPVSMREKEDKKEGFNNNNPLWPNILILINPNIYSKQPSGDGCSISFYATLGYGTWQCCVNGRKTKECLVPQAQDG
jgi:hypothetical protein